MTARTVTNTTETPFGLPNGVIVGPKSTVLVTDWGKVENNVVVKAWLAAGALTVSGAAAAAPAKQAAGPSLAEQAEALGIKVDGRWSDDRLRQEIAAAEAGAN